MAQAIVDHQTEFLEQGPRGHRAAEDAADRRQGRRPRDDGQPGRRRQVDSDAARHLSAQAVLRAAAPSAPTARKSPGTPCGSSCKKSSTTRTSSSRSRDDELVEELAKHGLTVARRTVTKYRKAMNIPSSRQRRDWSVEAPRAEVRRGAIRRVGRSDAGRHGPATATAPAGHVGHNGISTAAPAAPQPEGRAAHHADIPGQPAGPSHSTGRLRAGLRRLGDDASGSLGNCRAIVRRSRRSLRGEAVRPDAPCRSGGRRPRRVRPRRRSTPDRCDRWT